MLRSRVCLHSHTPSFSSAAPALDDLDGHLDARDPVIAPQHLPEGALADALLELVALVHQLVLLEQVVVVLVVPAVVVHALGRGRRGGRGGRSGGRGGH